MLYADTLIVTGLFVSRSGLVDRSRFLFRAGGYDQGVIAAVKIAEFLNETLWKDDRRLRKLQNMEMDADERAV
ncbi:hypothetical protein Tco_1191806 [Tanacetum coccineum]